MTTDGWTKEAIDILVRPSLKTGGHIVISREGRKRNSNS